MPEPILKIAASLLIKTKLQQVYLFIKYTPFIRDSLHLTYLLEEVK